MGKQMSGRTSIWWITDPTYNPDAPQAALLTSARNISCAIEQGYTLGPTASDTDDSATICDNANTTTFTLPNYEASLTMFREGDLAQTTTDFAKAWNFFKAGTAQQQEGYLVRRVGYLRDVVPEAGQEVSSFRFIPDNPQDVDDGSAPVRFTVDFQQQAKMSLFKALV